MDVPADRYQRPDRLNGRFFEQERVDVRAEVEGGGFGEVRGGGGECLESRVEVEHRGWIEGGVGAKRGRKGGRDE